MKGTAPLVAAVMATVQVQAKDDLLPDAKLRIGVKYRPEECTMKSELGDTLSMYYTGKLRKGGKTFDSNLDSKVPFEFELGAGSVIKGWDQGLVNMCIGEKRRLTIASDMGYGEDGMSPTIPPKATLVFNVELVAIKRSDDELQT